MIYNTLFDIVTEQLCPTNLLANTNKLPEYRHLLLVHQQEISSALRNIPYQGDASEIVQKHQIELGKLSDLLFNFRKSLGEDYPRNALLENFYPTVAKGFDDLLAYIVKEHPTAVHPSVQAPYSYASLLRIEFTALIKEILVLAQGKKIDLALLDLVLKPVKEIVNETEKRVTQRSLLYCQELLKQLVWVTESDGYDKRIYYTLMNLNFNSFEFYFYCIQKLESKLDKQENNAARLDLLTWFEKEIHTNPVKYPGIALEPSVQTWASQMLSRIRLEKKQLQSKPVNGKKATLIAVAGHKGKLEESLAAGFPKLNTALTVNQLAIMVRAYKDAGIITNSSPKTITFFITKMLTTKKAGDLSEPSFKTKYYKPSLANIAACKRWLQKVLVQLSKYEDADKKQK